MRTKSLVLIVIALGCGLVASIGISEVLKRPTNAEMEMESILVAAVDIDINKKLDAQNVKIEQWPKGKIQEGVLRSLEEAGDTYTRARLYAGEPILLAKLMDTKGKSTEIIPEGYVVIPIKVELDTVIGLIQPGDFVDIMVFLRQNQDIPKTSTYTILRMVRVFAVNTQTDRQTDEKGQEANARTVSLLVKPKQSERLALASELGKVRLALRRPTDEVPDEAEMDAELPAIFRGDQVAMDKEPQKSETPVSPVTPINPVVVTPIVSPQVTQPISMPPQWKMQLLSPSDVRHFEWSDETQLPQETSSPSSDASAPVTPEPKASEEPSAPSEIEPEAEPTKTE